MTTPHEHLEDLPLTGLLSRAVEVEAVLREAAVEQLRVAYAWAIAHPGLTEDVSVLDTPELLGGDGTPSVAAFTSDSLAVACGIAPTAGTALVADALDLHHRLPLVWDHTVAGLLEPWKARRIASRTRHLSLEAAGWVDRQIAAHASSVGRAQLDRLVAEATARVDGEALGSTGDRARAGWDVRLVHRDPATGGATTELHAIGDTLDLTRFHDLVCTEAETLGQLGDTDAFETRKAKALGVIAETQARLDLTTLLVPDTHTGSDNGTPLTLAEQKEIRDRIHHRRNTKIRLHLHASLADSTTSHDSAADSDSRDGAVATVEGHGPVTLTTIKEWIGGTKVTIVPVVHVASEDTWTVDRHDPPPAMAEQVRLRDTTCVFPRCQRPSRTSDLDHITPYVDPDEGGPPGQNHAANLAPLCRRHHRAKTTGHWTYQRTHPGTYLWTGPTTTALVTPQGTLTLPTN